MTGPVFSMGRTPVNMFKNASCNPRSWRPTYACSPTVAHAQQDIPIRTIGRIGPSLTNSTGKRGHAMVFGNVIRMIDDRGIRTTSPATAQQGGGTAESAIVAYQQENDGSIRSMCTRGTEDLALIRTIVMSEVIREVGRDQTHAASEFAAIAAGDDRGRHDQR